MKFEFEIPDDQIRAIVEREAGQLIRGTNWTLQGLIKQHMAKAVIEKDYGGLIETAIDKRAEIEINKAIDQKLPGFIKRQIKEMLKLARYKQHKQSEKK